MAEEKIKKAPAAKKATAPKATATKAPAAKKPAAAKAAPKAAATKKVAAEKPAKTGATVTIRQIKSGAGRSVKQNATLVGLGLRRIGKVSTVEDTVATRGMIKKVAHLIEIVDAA